MIKDRAYGWKGIAVDYSKRKNIAANIERKISREGMAFQKEKMVEQKKEEKEKRIIENYKEKKKI